MRDISVWAHPDHLLEQYYTPADIAAHIMFIANNDGNIEDRHIVDLGCGGGILGFGALFCGAKKVTFVDVSDESISTLKENLKHFDLVEGDNDGQEIEIIQLDIGEEITKESYLDISIPSCDTVIMNPPFGCYRKGIDTIFLSIATIITSSSPHGAVYSLHKSSTRSYLIKRVCGWARGHGRLTILGQFKYPLERKYKFHKKDEKEIEVDLIFIKASSFSPKNIWAKTR
eukprot:gnl/Carplike_NY0171/6234_a8561_286.p1 GENE.gnl/Carplike_NY0171/6234_a8561_286~~gnl/Carplike_NY0171/6234_a8561_286.p1  ORF type:complete len:240 (+),score=44.91 gnl/Carplike_NY0171/6234_a8561_286:36-722(+)